MNANMTQLQYVVCYISMLTNMVNTSAKALFINQNYFNFR